MPHGIAPSLRPCRTPSVTTLDATGLTTGTTRPRLPAHRRRHDDCQGLAGRPVSKGDGTGLGPTAVRSGARGWARLQGSWWARIAGAWFFEVLFEQSERRPV